MRANATIFITIQKPFTVFGVPPKMLIFVGAATAPVYAILVVAGLMILAFPVMLLMLISGCVYLWRKNREDCHYQQIALIGLPFFKGKASRLLLCGIPKSKNAKKEGAF